MATARSGAAEIEREARALLDQGQPFLAIDAAAPGLERFPENARLRQVTALALVQSGALEEARRVVEAIPGWAALDDQPFVDLHAAMRDTVRELLAETRDGQPPGEAALDALARVSGALERARGKRLPTTAEDPALLGLLGRVLYEIWQRSEASGDLIRCRDLYLQCFEGTGDAFAGCQAALTTQLIGQPAAAASLARRVRAAAPAGCPGADHDDAELWAAWGAMSLLGGDHDEAEAAYARAVAQAGRRYQLVHSARRALRRLSVAGVNVPDDLFRLLAPPTMVAFTGPPVDAPGRASPLFPPHLEAPLKAEIDRVLDRMGADIGYSSGAAGADLLFIEAMLERGAEVNVVLPFELEDFVRCAVRPAGDRWERRFRNALRLVDSVRFATEERFLGHDMLFRFGNQVLHGLARLRGGFIGADPYLLAVWDMMSGSLPGHAADFIDQWGDATKVAIIDIDDLAAEHPAPDVPPAAVPAGPRGDGGLALAVERPRAIKAMLFADLVGFSRLGEEHVPAFLTFVERLHELVMTGPRQPEFVKTWGDGIFAVAGRAIDIAEFALRLRDGVGRISRDVPGMPYPLRIRISLHAGPVFEAVDPFTGLANCYGTHINRTARLEPVTVPDQVFATQPLVALLTAEQAEDRNAAASNGEVYRERFQADYVGILPLAKGFGLEAVYHLKAAD